MHKYRFLLLACILTACAPCGKNKSDVEIEKIRNKGNPLIQIGDQKIYEGHFQILQELIPSFKANFSIAEGRKELVNNVIEQELFVQKAIEMDLVNRSPRLKKELWLQTRALLGGEYLYQALRDQAKEQYEKEKDQYYSEVEVADLMLSYGKDFSEENKRAVLEKAKKIEHELTSENFSKMASEYTEDPIGRGNEGKIGLISFIDKRVKELDWKPVVEKAYQLKPGQISGAIPTKEGVHFIQVIGEKKVRPFEDVASQIQVEILPRVKQQLLAKLKSETKIEILEPKLLPPETQKSDSQPATSAQ